MAIQKPLNNIVEQSPEATSSSLNVKNQLGQQTWVIINKADDKPINLHFSDFSDSERLWAQHLILHDFPYQDLRGTLRYAFSTISVRLRGIKVMVAYLQQQPSDKQQLSNWAMPDLVAFVGAIAIKDNKLVSVSSIRPSLGAVIASHAKRYELDGFPLAVPQTFIQKVVTPLCERFGLSYSDWEQGGSHGTVPMPVATLLLADAIKLIRSSKCKLLKCYFTAYRKKSLTTAMLTASKPSKGGIFNADIATFIEPSQVSSLTGGNSHTKTDAMRIDFVKILHDIEPGMSDFPFKSREKISEFVHEIEGACLAILLSVTGMRLSECHSVGADWLDAIEFLDVNGTWTKDAILRSKINKTSGGIIAKRGLSALGIEAFELLNALSWVDKQALGLKLFAPTYGSGWLRKTIKSNAVTTVIINTLRNRLQAYYRRFVQRAHQSVAEAYPYIKPHALRHLKMGFALRKFDGDVEAAIKQEYRHHDHHTQAYSRNQLNDEEISYVKREYVQDVIRRILINDPADRWVGPAMKRVRSVASKLLDGQNIELLSLPELAEFYDAMNDCVHSMTWHSYGLCFVMHDTLKLAKCGVKDNLVKAGDASSLLCSGCTNNGASAKAHYHDLELNKRRWQDTADCEIIARFSIVADAKKVVRNIEKLQADMCDHE